MSCCIAFLVSIHWKIKHLNNVLSTLCFYSRSRCRDLGSEVKKQGTVVGDKRSVQGIMGRGPSVPLPRDGSRLQPLHRPFRRFSLLNLTRLCLSSALDWLLDVQRAPVEGPKRVRLPLFQYSWGSLWLGSSVVWKDECSSSFQKMPFILSPPSQCVLTTDMTLMELKPFSSCCPPLVRCSEGMETSIAKFVKGLDAVKC